MIVG
jgi:hypothetical protein